MARCRVAPDARIEFLAIYRGHITTPLPFQVNDEVTQMMWWHLTDTVADLHAIDATIALLRTGDS